MVKYRVSLSCSNPLLVTYSSGLCAVQLPTSCQDDLHDRVCAQPIQGQLDSVQGCKETKYIRLLSVPYIVSENVLTAQSFQKGSRS